MANKVKVMAKILEIWGQTTDQREEKQLEISLKRAKVSSKLDIAAAEKLLADAESNELELEALLDEAKACVGEDWHPALILNAEDDLAEKSEDIKILKSNISRMNALVKLYL